MNVALAQRATRLLPSPRVGPLILTDADKAANMAAAQAHLASLPTVPGRENANGPVDLYDKARGAV